jgi:excisionase family DNA binding protein
VALVGRLREELTGADELLGIEEVARLLGVGQVTVWRWCREGALPCAKIGRKWRVRRGTLDEFVRRSERAQTLTGRLRVFVGVPDNLLAVTQDAELMRKLDPAFLRVGEARGGVLVKYQLEDERLPSLDDLREELRADGMDVGRLEGEGRLRLIAGSAASGGRPEEVRRLVAEVPGELGNGRTVWVNFNWNMSVGLEAALRQQLDLSELVEGESDLVVKTTVLEEDMDGWPGAEQRRAQVAHLGMVWLSRSGLVMSRVLPPPVL